MKFKIGRGLALLCMSVLMLIAMLAVLTAMRIIHDYPPIHLPTEQRARSVAVVLGAKTHDHRMSKVLQARVDEAIALYALGQVRYLLFTGGFRDKDPRREEAESALARAYAVKNGVPDAFIFTENVSTDTLSNLEQAQVIVAQQDFTAVLLVSDRWHLARAQLMAQDLGLHVLPAPVRDSAFRSKRTQLGFVWSEVLKIWAYCLGWRR